MKKMLITGGTVFVSRFAAQYFRGSYEVYVLNRGSRCQPEGVTYLNGDRHMLKDLLRSRYFDAVLDITAYDDRDVNDLLDALGGFEDYILISSSAVYPECSPQPFAEEAQVGPNRIWGKYGLDKIKAEKALLARVPGAYILRPPYLYGPGNNVYREAFVFDCALGSRPFRLPGNGEMPLQFFHVEDLCRVMESILKLHPQEHILNVGNPETVSVKEWVELCYRAAGKTPEYIQVPDSVEQRSYFPFYRYAYRLDVRKQRLLLPHVKDMEEGLSESLAWYRSNSAQVVRKPLLSYIDENL